MTITLWKVTTKHGQDLSVHLSKDAAEAALALHAKIWSWLGLHVTQESVAAELAEAREASANSGGYAEEAQVEMWETTVTIYGSVYVIGLYPTKKEARLAGKKHGTASYSRRGVRRVVLPVRRVQTGIREANDVERLRTEVDRLKEQLTEAWLERDAALEERDEARSRLKQVADYLGDC